MLRCFNMENCLPKLTPLSPGLLLTTENCSNTPKEANKLKNTLYWEALGSLMWLQVTTWSDITYAVILLSRFTHNPGKSHWTAIKHVLAYIKGTLNYRMTYKANAKFNLTRYVNSDFADYKDTCHSTKENIFIIAEGPVSWESKRQKTVALSTVEAEYMGFSRATTQALWISKYFTEIGLPTPKPIVVHMDNNGSISHNLNDKNHHRTKHIDVRHHFIKDQVKCGNITFQYIPSSENIANLFTKSLSWEKICQFTTELQLQLTTEGILDQGECWNGLVTLYLYFSSVATSLPDWHGTHWYGTRCLYFHSST